ncbi:hypothetical protein WAX78_01935 [Bacillus sp. FJAT-53711]|uniref:Uncharacterized protein n=1 Tax=Bacillus yunxiaonensis TaxID=3127665 RepID=A0ABU8FQH4_9BACI
MRQIKIRTGEEIPEIVLQTHHEDIGIVIMGVIVDVAVQEMAREIKSYYFLLCLFKNKNNSLATYEVKCNKAIIFLYQNETTRLSL